MQNVECARNNAYRYLFVRGMHHHHDILETIVAFAGALV
jgi:hypothetical protein